MSKAELFDVGPRLLNAARRPFFAYEPPVGKPYQPSNGIEGDMFMERWCDHCAKNTDDGDGIACCPILLASMCHDPGDEHYPPAWRIGTDHQPECTAFVEEQP